MQSSQCFSPTFRFKQLFLLTGLIRSFFTFFFCVLSSLAFFTANASQIDLAVVEDDAIGKHIEYFQERDGKLTLMQAQKYFAEKPVNKGNNHSISLGIGADPVWMKFSIKHKDVAPKAYRLAIETPWLDYIDTWMVKNGTVFKHVVGGDGVPFEQRPMPYRFYAFEHEFTAGVTDVYIRIESKGPMAIPVRLSTAEKAIKRDIAAGYQYGFLYGLMLALALYNLVLFVFIRQKEYGLYGVYLIGFVVNSLSYTGQLHTIFTPDYGAHFQDWVDIFLMITYSVAGLHFARVLLGTKSYAPTLDSFVVRTTLFIPLGMVVGLIFDQLVFSVALAFILNTCFVVLFIVMGIKALKAKRPFALIFIISSVTAAICITISTLAVAGILVPYNDYTFTAIEVGMAFEAIILAVILARQFRMAKMDKLIAETYARTDALTKVNNRHGFDAIAHSIWQTLVREKRDAAIVMIDIDSFKEFNDQYGHDIGDKVLKATAHCISTTARKGDVIARWGGEEFVVLLPEISQQQASAQAERIRSAIEELVVITPAGSLSITASLGIAGTENGLFNQQPITEDSIKTLINAADDALYVAKNSGRNQIFVNQAKAS